MDAARYHGARDLRVESVAVPSVGPDEIRIEVAACGICGTDLHEYDYGPKLIPAADAPHPVTGQSLPLTMGHEFAGTVVDAGAEAGFAVGDRVTVEPNRPCRACAYCRAGAYNRCTDAVGLGIHTDGAFAAEAVVPAELAHPLPDAVTLEEGALVEPLAVGLHAVRRAGVTPGDTVAVFGAGPIGLTVVRAAADTARRVIVSEPQAARRVVAEAVGATVTVDPLAVDDAAATVCAHTPEGLGVDHAFEFAGLGATFNAAVAATKRGGTVTVGSITESTVETDLNDLVLTERTVQGTFTYGYPPLLEQTEFGAVVDGLAAGRIDVEPFITGRVSLSEAPAAFDTLLAGDAGHVKILVEP